MNNQIGDIIRDEIQDAQRILAITHIRPDGDAIGSLLGLGLALQEFGKDVTMVSVDGVPANFQHLPGSDHVVKQPESDYDLIVVVDCSDLSRVGDALHGYAMPDLNIDHHVTNLNFAKKNLVETTAVATTEILAMYLPNWGMSITQSIASVLLTGIITDTLGFGTSNMTSRALRISAELMDLGADLPDLYYRALKQRSFPAMRFWGSGLSMLEREGPIVWTTLTLAERRNVGYPGRDDADLINILSSIADAVVSLIFVEQPNGTIKVSWRAQPGVDVSRIALRFGGGGHPAAAGAEIEGALENVRKLVLQETSKLLVKLN